LLLNRSCYPQETHKKETLKTNTTQNPKSADCFDMVPKEVSEFLSQQMSSWVSPPAGKEFEQKLLLYMYSTKRHKKTIRHKTLSDHEFQIRIPNPIPKTQISEFTSWIHHQN
jgi:hypothetical protein